MTEAGDPTDKYMEIRKMIGRYFPLPDVPVPSPVPKTQLPDVQMKPVSVLMDTNSRRHLASYTINGQTPLTFEALNQYSGFLLYETKLPKVSRDPAQLKINDLRDRAYVYVNRQFVGVLSREN